MSIVIVTGSSGLIGSEAARFFSEQGFDVVGIDNGMREYFFGAGSATDWNRDRLIASLPSFRHLQIDIRDVDAIERCFGEFGTNIACVVHAAAQPSHDWAAKEPLTDFSVNATGTLVLLEATRRHAPDAVFIFTSTNKVYGDRPNSLPFVEEKTRWSIDPSHPYASHGIPETMSIDSTLHSVFGASKVAADVMVQEYAGYFGLKTIVFRGGCLTGPSHSAAELHGFLAYLVSCAARDKPYTVFGYKGKQVRDNIHSHDLVAAFWETFQNPRPGAVYNIGGGTFANCSVLEAIDICEELTGREMIVVHKDANRKGDHIWWISDVRRFQADYPDFIYKYSLRETIEDLYEGASSRQARP